MTDSSAADLLDSLTAKQREVLERLTSHQSIKTIADAMGVSETRINQHIRTIKDRLGVNDKADLAALWMEAGRDPFRNSAYRKKQLPHKPDLSDETPAADTAMLHFQDAGAFRAAPWELPEYHRVGPGLLDGPGALAKRVGFIILVAIGLPIAVISTLSAMMALTEMLRAFH